MVENVELAEGRWQNDLPYTFCGISEEGHRFLEEHKLLRVQETYQTIYTRIEKTANIKGYESASRPER